LARARAAALVVPPAPVPPLPPLPAVPPPPLTHEQIVAAAWREVERTSAMLNQATITKKQAEPNREYAKKLCEYARVSVDHIYKVNAAIVRQDMDAIDAEMKNIVVSKNPFQGKTVGFFITNSIGATIGKITGNDTQNYCADFNDPSKSYTDILKSILGNIQKTVDVDKKCVDVIVNSVSVIREIIRPYDTLTTTYKNELHTKLFPMIKKIKEQLNTEITELNQQIKVITNLGWFTSVKTDKDNLKRLSDNLHEINKKIGEMMEFYKQVVKIYKDLEPKFLQIEKNKAAAAAAAATAAGAAGAAAAAAAGVLYQATTAAGSHSGVPAVQTALEVVAAASAAAAAASTAATAASQTAATATNLADKQRYQQEAETQKTLAESELKNANDAMTTVTSAVAAAAAAVAVSPLIVFGGLVTAAAKSIAGILGKQGQRPNTLPSTDNIKTETNDLIEPLLAEMEQKIQEDVEEIKTFTHQQKINKDKLDKLKEAVNAIQAPPPPSSGPSSIQNDITDLENLLTSVNENIDKMIKISTTLQTDTTYLINEIKQDIGNITPSTTQLDKGTFENIKNKSERLTQLYNEMKVATEQLKTDINEKRQQYNVGFEATKQTVLTGIQQRLTAIVDTLNQPPTDRDGAQLIVDIDRLLDSVN
jgi:hypothetical protein